MQTIKNEVKTQAVNSAKILVPLHLRLFKLFTYIQSKKDYEL